MQEDQSDRSDDLGRNRKSKASDAREDRGKPLDTELDQQDIDDTSLLDGLDQEHRTVDHDFDRSRHKT